MVYIISWFIIGFIGGILCSVIDVVINDHKTFEVRMPILLSFLGGFLILWFFLYEKESRRLEKERLRFFQQYKVDFL